MADTNKTILIVDDDKDLREILLTKLNSLGFKVAEASDGQSGIKKAKEIKPDLILLDVRMPVMSGIETLAAIKKDPDLANLKVVFLTNLGEAEEQNSWLDDKFAKEAGALGHIKKTDDLEKIMSRIQEILSTN